MPACRTGPFLGRCEMEGRNWKISVDNFIDSHHFATLHRDTVSLKTPSNIAHYERFGPNIRAGYPNRSIAQLRGVPLRAVVRGGRPALLVYSDLIPGCRDFRPRRRAYGVYAEHSRANPGEELQRPPSCAQTSPEGRGRSREVRKNHNAGLSIARDEDYGMGLQIQRGLGSRAHEDVMFGHDERGNQSFHEWLDWKGEPGSAKPVV